MAFRETVGAEAFDLVKMGRDDTRAAAAFWAGRSWGLADTRCYPDYRALLTAEQLDAFHRDGVLALPSRFSPDEVAASRALEQELQQGVRGAARILDLWTAESLGLSGREIFEITGLLRVFEVFATEQEAVRAFAGGVKASA